MKLRISIASVFATIMMLIALPSSAFAHVSVSPKSAAIGERTTYTVSVPNEKDMPVTRLKLEIPPGFKDIQPTVHTGWTIATEKDEKGNVTIIRWEGGSIPAGQRDDFTFRGQNPASGGEIIWKAYQTYSDGTTVAWDQKPTAGESEGSGSGPYSATSLREEGSAEDGDSSSTDSTGPVSTATKPSAPADILPLGVSLLALVVSIAALLRRKK